MAPRKASNTNGTGTEVVDWEAEMAKQAEVAAASQRAMGGGGKFFGMAAGTLSFDGQPLPGNQMAVIILADTMMNSYYEGKYDPDNRASPKCFAFAKDESQLEPHANVDADPYFDRQNDVCAGCPQNEWGSADTGKGKACQNRVRLAMIPAGSYKPKGGRNAGFDLELFDDPDHFKSAEEAFMNLPVTSVAEYTTFVRGLAAELRRPPHGVIANVYLEAHLKHQFHVKFEVLEELPKELMPIIMPRHKKSQEGVAFPYSPPAEDDAPAKPANNKLAKKAPVKGRR